LIALSGGQGGFHVPVARGHYYGRGIVSGWIGVFIVAFLGATVTVGLQTGSLAPVYPGVSRADAPLRFWSIMTVAAVFVAANVIGLLAKL